ncbi:Chloroperoxidase [Mycena alexandri]|uniref:Chloroperoxidase n=1 Tax=Mycena alexandri TaxID=1745969 RepID=A0AAD6WWF0_9AGAR|nr:Chloroperoxidase [Mycena alexandri]
MKLFFPLVLFQILYAIVSAEVQDGQTGVVIMLPPQPTDTGLKQIPDADHPFIAPGLDDQRGPCPAMNTLANHGYIPRNGIVSFEEAILGTMEGLNMDIGIVGPLAANALLMRGNPFINKFSIGGVSPLVPPLPGKIDGPEVGGIAKHGRFEGDASMTRSDAFIGDNRDFQDILYDMDLLQLGKFGSNGPDGNNTVFNIATMIGVMQHNTIMYQAADPKFTFSASRVTGASGAAAFLLDVFANGTTKQSTLPIIGSFLRNQTFPPNWFRADTPVTGAVLGPHAAAIEEALPFSPGRNDAHGVYVADPLPPAPFNSSLGCWSYWEQAANTPAVLQNTTGIFKQNVDFLMQMQFTAVLGNPACDQQLLPFGPSGV